VRLVLRHTIESFATRGDLGPGQHHLMLHTLFSSSFSFSTSDLLTLSKNTSHYVGQASEAVDTLLATRHSPTLPAVISRRRQHRGGIPVGCRIACGHTKGRRNNIRISIAARPSFEVPQRPHYTRCAARSQSSISGVKGSDQRKYCEALGRVRGEEKHPKCCSNGAAVIAKSLCSLVPSCFSYTSFEPVYS
jgi:hypothetical protein